MLQLVRKLGVSFLQTRTQLTGQCTLITRNMSGRPQVYVTRRVPEAGLEILRQRCDITQWSSDDPVPRDQLIKNVYGKDALFCLLTDRIDKEVLDAAGKSLMDNVKIQYILCIMQN